MRVGVIGAGWAGLAAACELVRLGHAVEVWEQSPHLGGRGRSGVTLQVQPAGTPIEVDCGQHILIGAYAESLQLMQRLGVDLEAALLRLPLQLLDARGKGLKTGRGPTALALAMAVLRNPGWHLGQRLELMGFLLRWRLDGFACDPRLSVAALCAGMSRSLLDEFIEPLCVAALNTTAGSASAAVFLKVLSDGLFGGAGASDLLLPRVPLAELLPKPARQHLERNGAKVHTACGVSALHRTAEGAWRVQDSVVDRVIVATSAPQARGLVAPFDPEWASQAAGLSFEPIVTTWVHSPGSRLAAPMIRLDTEPAGPAQFLFDLGAMGHAWKEGFAFVSSAASPWLTEGIAGLERALMNQARGTRGLTWATPPRVVRSVAERRATFRCTAGLLRPRGWAAGSHGGLWIAGDYVAGPYPSTLEGAVRSGLAAARGVDQA